MKVVTRVDGQTRLVRVGRDGKNRYCLYYNNLKGGPSGFVRVRIVVAGGLTKLGAAGMLKLMKEK